LGKLKLPESPSVYVAKRLLTDGVTPLPVEHAHALHVSSLPRLHSDPFDRLLVAQAQLEGFALLTADRRLSAYDVETIWAGQG